MTLHIALLRSVNLAGRNQIAMSDLKDMLTSVGLAHARTLLQSGNLLFHREGRTRAELERLLERATEQQFELRTDYFVRTANEWQTVVARNPFPAEAKADPSHLVVTFLKQPPPKKQVEALQAAVNGPEIVRAGDEHVYIVYPAGIGHSKLTTALIEKTLGSRATGRNWNTVLKLQALTRA